MAPQPNMWLVEDGGKIEMNGTVFQIGMMEMEVQKDVLLLIFFGLDHA